MRALLMIGLIACMGWASPVRAQWFAAPDGPVCRRPEVLDVVDRELRRRITYAEIEPATIWEKPTTESDVVQCSLCLAVRGFDTEHDGPIPYLACQLHGYAVKSVRAGFVIRDIE